MITRRRGARSSRCRRATATSASCSRAASAGGGGARAARGARAAHVRHPGAAADGVAPSSRPPSARPPGGRGLRSAEPGLGEPRHAPPVRRQRPHVPVRQPRRSEREHLHPRDRLASGSSRRAAAASTSAATRAWSASIRGSGWRPPPGERPLVEAARRRPRRSPSRSEPGGTRSRMRELHGVERRQHAARLEHVEQVEVGPSSVDQGVNGTSEGRSGSPAAAQTSSARSTSSRVCPLSSFARTRVGERLDRRGDEDRAEARELGDRVREPDEVLDLRGEVEGEGGEPGVHASGRPGGRAWARSGSPGRRT